MSTALAYAPPPQPAGLVQTYATAQAPQECPLRSAANDNMPLGYNFYLHLIHYNTRHQLCRHYTQSGRAAVCAYDAAGQMTAYNKGKG